MAINFFTIFLQKKIKIKKIKKKKKRKKRKKEKNYALQTERLSGVQ